MELINLVGVQRRHSELIIWTNLELCYAVSTLRILTLQNYYSAVRMSTYCKPREFCSELL
jgi:hypothetical protein